MTPPDEKTFSTAAASLACKGYALTRSGRGYCVQGPSVRFCTPKWATVTTFLHLQFAK